MSVSPRQDVTAIVLAGGRSSRFGSPKLVVKLDGATLLDHALRAVGSVAGNVIVAGPKPASQLRSPIRNGGAHEPRHAAAPSVRFVVDDQPFAGPLAALAGALRETSSELAIVVGGDMPGLVPAVLAVLLQRLESDVEVAAVHLAGKTAQMHRQALPLGLRVAPAADAAAEALAMSDRSLMRLLDRLHTVEIPAPEWLPLDPAGRTLLDIDAPADLELWDAGEIR